MRYMVDVRGIEPEEALALYRAVLNWAARHGDQFVLRLIAEAYEGSEVFSRLVVLGESREVAPPGGPPGIFGRAMEKLWGRRQLVEVTGRLSGDFVRALTEYTAPLGAVAGDLSPAEDVLVLAGDRTLYASYDYGRTQMLDLANEELIVLRQALSEAGLDPNRVTAAPPQLTETGEPPS